MTVASIAPYATPMPEPERNGGAVVRWAQVGQAAAAIAERIAGTEFVPEAMRGNPAVVTAAIMYGDELGIGPMQALAGINVIKGKPTPSSELQRALVLREGHTLRVLASDGTHCRLMGQRIGERDGVVIEWTLEMARAAGLLANPTWQRYPRAMLIARATSELCRVVFPDVIKGLAHIADDDESAASADDWVAEGAGDTAREPAPSTTTVARTPREQPRATRKVRDVPLPAAREPETPLPPMPGEPSRHDVWPEGAEQPSLPLMPPMAPLEPDGGGVPPITAPPPSAPPEPLPVPDETTAIADETAEPAPRMLAAIHTLYGDLGVGADDRPLKLAITAAAVGHKVETHKHLTRREGLALIRVLNDMAVGLTTFGVNPDGTVHIYAREADA